MIKVNVKMTIYLLNMYIRKSIASLSSHELKLTVNQGRIRIRGRMLSSLKKINVDSL